MDLFTATLDLARYAQGLETHKITAVDNPHRKFSCSDLNARLGEYTNGGTCWFTRGELTGQFGSIVGGANQTIQLLDTYDKEYAVGDEVMLSWFHYFNTQNLINAINHVLYDYPIMKIYDEPDEKFGGTYTHRGLEYELPDEVTTDIRRVEIQDKRFPPNDESYSICHYWHLNDRILIIDPHWAYREHGKIRLHYVEEHGPVSREEPFISDQVDKTYLRKMANLWLWAHEIQMKHKDNPIAVDMYNNARMDEESLLKKNIPTSRLMAKDICYFW